MTTLQYFRFFQDLWRFFKDHAEPVSDDGWWSRLADQADELANRYGGTEFVTRMTSAVIWEIDRLFQQRRGKHEERIDRSE
jgi:hypothetical protein